MEFCHAKHESFTNSFVIILKSNEWLNNVSFNGIRNTQEFLCHYFYKMINDNLWLSFSNLLQKKIHCVSSKQKTKHSLFNYHQLVFHIQIYYLSYVSLIFCHRHWCLVQTLNTNNNMITRLNGKHIRCTSNSKKCEFTALTLSQLTKTK